MNLKQTAGRRKSRRAKPLRKSCAACPSATHMCAYMHAINASNMSDQARYIAGQIALNLEEISRLMREERRGFYEALRACAFPDEYFPPLMVECLESGLLEPSAIGELPALLPRLPGKAQP